MPFFKSVDFPRIGSNIRKLPVLAIALASFSAWGQPNALDVSAKTLGAAQLNSIRFSGTGHWFQFGQAPNPDAAWPQFDVSSYAATINYETPAARVQITRNQTVEPGRLRPAPVEQKPDQYVSGALAWNLSQTPGGTQPAVQPQPAAVEERLSEIWTTPQGFLKAAQANHATIKALRSGAEVSFAIGKNRYVGTINAEYQVVQVKTWIDSPVLGDTPVEYTYSEYQDFGGVPFPAKILRKQGGHPVLALAVRSVIANADAAISIPAEVSNAPVQQVKVTADELAPGVFYLRGGTHHSVAVEQRDHVVLIEAPLNEARSDALIAKIKEIAPGKPIRFVVNTHQHFDHSGGLRTFVDYGATIVTHEQNQPYYQKVWKAPRSINPDHLALSQKAAKFKTFTDKLVLNDGARPIEVRQITGSGHDDVFALVYLPNEKILIEADAYTPLAANATAPATPNPYTLNLYDNIVQQQLDVQQIAALHGPRVATLDDLLAAIGAKSVARN